MRGRPIVSALERIGSSRSVAHASPVPRIPPAKGLMARLASADTTLPQLLRQRAQQHGDALAIREKDLGIWQRQSWRQYNETARLVAFGLLSLGLQPGDRIAIASEN